MDLIAIVITVCALADPDRCEEQRIEFSSQFSLRQCVMNAQPISPNGSLSIQSGASRATIANIRI